MYQTEPEPGFLAGGRCSSRAARSWRSSSINGRSMCAASTRITTAGGSGNVGWLSMTCCPYFKKAENQTRGADTGATARCRCPTGATPIRCRKPRRRPSKPAFPSTDHGATQEGAGFFQTTTRRGRRASSAFSYRVRPRAAAICTSRHPRRRDGWCRGRRARAVEYGQNGTLRIAGAQGDPGSSGAYNSPQLLQLGRGPAELLKTHGIDVASMRSASAAICRIICRSAS